MEERDSRQPEEAVAARVVGRAGRAIVARRVFLPRIRARRRLLLLFTSLSPERRGPRRAFRTRIAVYLTEMSGGKSGGRSGDVPPRVASVTVDSRCPGRNGARKLLNAPDSPEREMRTRRSEVSRVLDSRALSRARYALLRFRVDFSLLQLARRAKTFNRV